MTSQISAVLFDLDGTLVETHIDFPAMTQAMDRMARDAGVPVDVTRGQDILGVVYASKAWLDSKDFRFVNSPLEEGPGEVDSQSGCAPSAEAWDSVGSLPFTEGLGVGSGSDGKTFQANAFAILEELEVDGCGNPIEIPGAASTLSEIKRRGIGIGIVTRNCRKVSQKLIDTFGLTCDTLLTRDDVPRVKPDPDHLHRALAKLGVQPRQSMMVGDHWMDIRAGIDAGCRSTIGLLHGRTPEFYVPCPPLHLAVSITEVLQWL